MVIRKTLATLFWRDRLAAGMILFAFLLNVGLWMWLWSVIPEPESFRVLRYSTYFGITDFGPGKNLFQIPLLGSIFWFVNLMLAFFFALEKKHDVHLILGVNIIIQILLILPTFMIVSTPLV